MVEWWSGGVVEWWSGGVVEWWSGGVVEWWSVLVGLLVLRRFFGVVRAKLPPLGHPMLQYSNTPILHYSNTPDEDDDEYPRKPGAFLGAT